MASMLVDPWDVLSVDLSAVLRALSMVCLSATRLVDQRDDQWVALLAVLLDNQWVASSVDLLALPYAAL